MDPVLTAHLFADLHHALLQLLEPLEQRHWQSPTACRQWMVQDIASHMLDTQLRALSMGRDSHFLPPPEGFELVPYLNHLNHSWVDTTRRLSSSVLLELIRQTGPLHASYMQSLDPFAPALFPVAWAGETHSLNWFHIGRDYTEYWHHQQQIRDAVSAPPLTSRHFLGPAFEIMIRAIPHAYRNFDVPSLEIEITGESGGVWHYSTRGGLAAGPASQSGTRIVIAAEDAWRLFTNGLKAPRLEAAGDPMLIRNFLTLRAVMA